MCIGHMQIFNYSMYMDLLVLVFAGGPGQSPADTWDNCTWRAGREGNAQRLCIRVHKCFSIQFPFLFPVYLEKDFFI